MTNTEALDLLESFKSIWPQFKTLTKSDADVWMNHLRDVSRSDASEVAKLLLIESARPPGVAAFYERYKAYQRKKKARAEFDERELARQHQQPTKPKAEQKAWAKQHLEEARERLANRPNESNEPIDAEAGRNA